MEKILDKLILLICCGIFLLAKNVSVYTVVPIIIIVIFTSINISISNSSLHIGSYLLYLVLCFFYPDLMYFIPLMCYDLFCEPYKYVSGAGLLIFYINNNQFGVLYIFMILGLCLLTFLLKTRTSTLLTTRNDHYLMKDEMTRQWENLNYKNRELLEKQDYEITNATLNERNRIAREIHDTIGHLLSSAILQIGAITSITKDEFIKSSLLEINNTLSTGMDSIRSSIHNLHEESVDLNLKLKELIDDFEFCTVNYTYNINNELSVKAKYSIIFIIKEALANITKHSNASVVDVLLVELPGFYRVIISDNGYSHGISSNSGMGLSSISERVSSLDGNISISKDKGFKIFITLPKNTK